MGGLSRLLLHQSLSVVVVIINQQGIAVTELKEYSPVAGDLDGILPFLVST